MKKLIILPVLCLLIACSQKQEVVGDARQLPVTKLDVEQLNGDIDLDMDISGLPLSDLRILRNAFAARQGYPFRDSYLRSVYGTTTWYDSLMWAFDDTSENFEWKEEEEEGLSWRDQYYVSIRDEAIKYTPEELAFIERIKMRELELQKLNFETGGNGIVNLGNVVNPGLLVDPDPLLPERLAQNGFAIVPASHEQLFHVYEQNDYHEFPSFVTTDLFLQLYHVYFDCVMREVEQEGIYPLLEQFTRDMYLNTNEWATKSNDVKLREAALHNSIFFAIAHQLLTGNKLPLGENQVVADEEVARVLESENDHSNFIGEYSVEDQVKFAYSLFRPRGHYTRSEKLQRYFRAMMWLQSVPFGLDAPMQLEYAVQMADALHSYDKNMKIYNEINRLITFLMGPSDNLSLVQVIDEVGKTGLSCQQLLNDEKQLNQLRKRLNDIGNQQTRIRPKFEYTSHNKICLMPQRYQPDAEVLQEMVDYDSPETKRALPKGLDVLAAMGVGAAEKILLDELKEAQQWEGFKPNLQRMKQRMDSINWKENAATQWLETAKTVVERNDSAPYFMQTPLWDRKSLNAALSAWAELKHDAILYAKQPMGAECGGGGPPEPVVRGYVEPNVKFWRKVIELIEATQKALKDGNALTEKAERTGDELKEKAEFLLLISEKELKGEVLKDEEYDQLEYIGAAFENMTIELLRDPEHEMWGWESVQGPDRKVALVADVYTANADNNPAHSILYESIGLADEIYVVVEVEGYLYLMRGAVFSYREFNRPTTEQRMTDEEWHKRLEKYPREGVPEWMTPIIVPMESAPVDNEEVFYSSGC